VIRERDLSKPDVHGSSDIIARNRVGLDIGRTAKGEDLNREVTLSHEP